MTAVIDAYDAALFDLDGVVYRGPDAIPGVAAGISRLHELGIRVGFVTNNAARSPSVVAQHLVRIGVPATPDDIVTSAQAVARIMAADLPAGAGVLVVGTQALADEVRAAGFTLVPDATHNPEAIVVGFSPEMTWDELNEAAYAVQQGATWYACNPDRTRPTDRGLAIGLGAMLDVLGEVLPGRRPILAGKPYRPLLDETVRRLAARHPIFVGDRLDTDIEGANHAGLDSMFVLSGSHGPDDLFAAPPHQRPTYLADDVRGLLLPPTEVDPGLVQETHGALTVVDGIGPDRRLAVIWTAAQLVWQAADQGRSIDAAEVSAALSPCPAPQ